MTLRIGVLISGRGSNLQALIDACAEPAYPAEIAVVISNEPGARGLARARDAGLPAEVVEHRAFGDRSAFEDALTDSLRRAGVELVCAAGFMRVLTGTFLDVWRDRVVNVHPSLLPAFRGLRTHERAIRSGVRFSGCTVHFVRADLDAGPVIVQSAVPVLPADTPEDLAARVLESERECLPLAVRWIAEGRVRIVDETVRIDGAGGPADASINPPPDLPPSSPSPLQGEGRGGGRAGEESANGPGGGRVDHPPAAG